MRVRFWSLYLRVGLLVLAISLSSLPRCLIFFRGYRTKAVESESSEVSSSQVSQSLFHGRTVFATCANRRCGAKERSESGPIPEHWWVMRLTSEVMQRSVFSASYKDRIEGTKAVRSNVP